MDETTISDIKQRVARWERGYKIASRSELERCEHNWIYAVNLDDVNLLLKEIERAQKENDDLRLQLQAAREQLAYAPTPEFARVYLDSEALEPDAPDGQMKHFFNVYSGPYQALDTQQERDFTWAYGPYSSFAEADREWKAHIKRQREIGK